MSRPLTPPPTKARPPAAKARRRGAPTSEAAATGPAIATAPRPAPRPAPSAPARKTSRFEPPVAAFLAYLKIECGFAPATRAAYGGDLRDLWVWMVKRDLHAWTDLTPDLIAEHLR
ncbi:MAG: site-specific integrase, partial [Planctomycetota bacterium]